MPKIHVFWQCKAIKTGDKRTIGEGDCPENGVITVFFALSLLIILSFIFSMLELARGSTASGYLDLMSETAVKSAFADYYGPLFEEYHVFGLDVGYGYSKRNMERFGNSVTESLGRNLTGFFSGEISRCEISNTKYLSDEKGDAFGRQAIAYEKYSAAGNLISDLMDKLDILGKQDKQLKILKEEMALTEQFSVMDECILELMEASDGIRIKKGAAVFDREGLPEINDRFIKAYCPADISMTGLLVNNQMVYTAMCSKINTSKDRFVSWKAYGSGAASVSDELRYLRQERDSIIDIIDGINDEISLLESETDGSNEAETDALVLELEEYEARISLLDERIDADRELLDRYESASNSLHDELYSAADGALGCLNNALDVVNRISVLQDKLKPMVENFEKLLLAGSALTDENYLNETMERLAKMKAYIGLSDENETGMDLDFSLIRTSLTNDKKLLEQITGMFPDAIPGMDNASWETVIEEMIKLTNLYSIEGLRFDYSTLKASESEGGWAEFLMSLVEGGVEALVIDPKVRISDKVLNSSALPSKSMGSSIDESKDNRDNETGIFSGINISASVLSPSGFLESADLSAAANLAAEGIRSAADRILLCGYANDHFSEFLTAAENSPTALSYELEYLAAGKKQDSDNLSSVINRIFLLRGASCIAYAVTDSKMRKQAELAAAAVIGFTGLPFLVQAVKYLILTVWALEQALVETCAVMKGKTVPVITGKDCFCVAFEDILHMKRENIQKKADGFSNSKKEMDYDDYIDFFLLLQKRQTQEQRMLDLIQENLRLCYEDGFRIENCMTGCEVLTSIRLDTIFFGAAAKAFGGTYGSYEVNSLTSFVY